MIKSLTSLSNEQVSPKRIYVGLLPTHIQTHVLKEYLSKFVEVTKLKLRFRSKGVCAGYGHAVIVGTPA